MHRITFYYDVVSPYSMIGFQTLTQYASIWPISVHYKPVFLGGVMSKVNHMPPASNPAKGQYLMKEIAMMGEMYEIPLQMPGDFPGKSLLAQRILIYIHDHHPAALIPLSCLFWNHHWIHGGAIDNVSALKQCLKQVHLDADEILAAAVTPENKRRLADTTDEAIDLGMFGAPFMDVQPVDGERFTLFGSDRFDLLAFKLGLEYRGPQKDHFLITRAVLPYTHPEAKL